MLLRLHKYIGKINHNQFSHYQIWMKMFVKLESKI